jgi:prepilin-type N-terminal cleavage/methylation domain-containing protein
MEPFYLRRGFTLIELLVVLAIIITITSVALASQSSFNKTLILTNTAYDIALALRSAETYGLGSRAVQGVDNTGYGLDFNAATPGSFTFFADTFPGPSSFSCHGLPAAGADAPDAKPGDCVYETSQGEKITDYTLGNGITVSDFCAFAFNSWSCVHSNGNNLTSLDIVFARPNPQAFVSVNGSYSISLPVTRACLVVSSPQGGQRYVSVAASGAITANASSCP